MNRNIVLILLFLLPSIAVAQVKFKLGLKAGMGISKVNLSGTSISQGTDVIPADSKISFHGGAYSRLQIGSFFLQPEVYYTSIGSQAIFESGSVNQAIRTAQDYNLNRIDVPVLVGFRLGDVVRIGAGPVLSAVTGSTSVHEKLNAATLGLQAGLGLDLGKFSLDFRYETGLSRFSNSLTIPGTNRTFPADQRMNQFMFSLGYAIF
jgi:Outer membrane protein beta-barrel domain